MNLNPDNQLLNHPLLRQQSKSLFWWKEGLLPLSHDWTMQREMTHNHISVVTTDEPSRQHQIRMMVGVYAHSRYRPSVKPFPESFNSFIFEI